MRGLLPEVHDGRLGLGIVGARNAVRVLGAKGRDFSGMELSHGPAEIVLAFWQLQFQLQKWPFPSVFHRRVRLGTQDLSTCFSRRGDERVE